MALKRAHQVMAKASGADVDAEIQAESDPVARAAGARPVAAGAAGNARPDIAAIALSEGSLLEGLVRVVGLVPPG